MRRNTVTKRVLWLAVLFILVFLQVSVYARFQPQIAMGEGRGDDGVYYGRMAEQFARGESPKADAPFVYRIGVPWLASRLSLLTTLSIDESFQMINMVTFFLLIAVIYLLAQRFCSPPYAALTCILYNLPYYNYARLIYFYPVHVDTLWFIFVLCALLLMISPRRSPGTLIGLCLLSALAILIRENAIVIPLTFLLSLYPIRRYFSLERLLGVSVLRTDRETPSRGGRDAVWGLAILGCSLLAVVFTRLIGQPTGTYSFGSAILDSVQINTVWHIVVALAMAFGGPLLGVLLMKRQLAFSVFSAFPEFTVYVGLSLVLGYIGGVDTVRFFSWSAPVVLTVIVMGLESIVAEARRIRQAPAKFLYYGLVLLLLSVNVVIQHPFWGYYDDYTPWKVWGGTQFSEIRSLKPILLCIVLTGVTVTVWNLTRERIVTGQLAQSDE
jgi:hypothetical protein